MASKQIKTPYLCFKHPPSNNLEELPVTTWGPFFCQGIVPGVRPLKATSCSANIASHLWVALGEVGLGLLENHHKKGGENPSLKGDGILCRWASDGLQMETAELSQFHGISRYHEDRKVRS